MSDLHHDPISSYTDSVAALAADQAADRAIKVAIESARSAEEAEWTAEVTTNRRKAWNGLVKAALAQSKGKLTAMQVAGLEKKAGFTLTALKGHVARHGL